MAMPDYWHPNMILPGLFATMCSILGRAQITPTAALLSANWIALLNYLLPYTTPSTSTDQSCTVINAQSGTPRTNYSPILEHLLWTRVGSHPGRRQRRGALRVTLLYTSQFPGIPSAAADQVARWSLFTMVAQIALAGVLAQIGIASATVLTATAADALLGFIVWEFLRWARYEDVKTVRAIPRGEREVICIAAGRDATDAVIVVNEAGAASLEDLAQKRVPPLTCTCARLVGVPFFPLVMWLLTVAFSRLAVADAWCLIIIWAPGFAHATYAAQTWRAPSALGFKFAEKETRVVQGDEDMETLAEVENIEREAGRALIAFFFPERRHPDGLV